MKALIFRNMEELTIDHDCLLSELVEGQSSIDRAPVEFYGASNTVDTASKNKHTMVIKRNVVGGGIVCGLEFVN